MEKLSQKGSNSNSRKTQCGEIFSDECSGGRREAIITRILPEQPRDILEEQIRLHGITLNVIDTAGIRETEDIVEQIGVSRARQMADQADLIIYVVDGSRP